MNGIKMITNSPVRVSTPIDAHGLDVTQYQPPWHALSEIAMTANFNIEHLSPNNPELRRLASQVWMD